MKNGVLEMVYLDQVSLIELWLSLPLCTGSISVLDKYCSDVCKKYARSHLPLLYDDVRTSTNLAILEIHLFDVFAFQD